VQTSSQNQEDGFGLQKMTHAKDSRIGIIARTVVSATANIPIGLTF
jgi:squalene cyclase